MHWAMRDPKRFMREHEALDELVAEVDWIDSIHWRIALESFLVEVDVNMLVHGQRREVSLTYPDVFPESPAYICPRESTAHWSIHQYGAGGGPFCLEWRADNWQRTVTGADLVRSLYTLLATESNPEQPEEVPSAHRITQGQDARARRSRLVATSGLVRELAALSANSAVPIQTSTIFHKDVLVCVVTKMANSEGELTPIVDVPSGVSSNSPLFTWKREGLAFRMTAADPPSIENTQDLLTVTRRVGIADETIMLAESTTLKDAVFLLAYEETGAIGAVAIQDGDLRSYLVLKAEDIHARLPISDASLKEKRVAIIGLGSLGSKIAVSLARSGVRKFLVVDDDIFLPENLSRNEFSWSAVGLHKVQAIQEALFLVAAEIEVDVRMHRLAGQESSVIAARVFKSIGDCDLIIDATANPEVFIRLAATARTNRQSICWGEVYAGGIGGMIARARPGIDPNPLAVRDGFSAYLQDKPPAPYRKATNYDVIDGEPIVADDADVTQIASSLARLALDTLVEAHPTAFPSQVYLIGLRPEWMFSSAFDTRAIDVEGEGWDVPQFSDEERSTAARILVSMISKEVDDRPDPTGGNTRNH